MIATLAFLTTPAPGRYVLNNQPEGKEGIEQFEISHAHLTNIVIDGAALALREIHRVPLNQFSEEAHGSVNRQ